MCAIIKPFASPGCEPQDVGLDTVQVKFLRFCARILDAGVKYNFNDKNLNLDRCNLLKPFTKNVCLVINRRGICLNTKVFGFQLASG